VEDPNAGGGRRAAGADLIIPLLALAFAAYFFVSIADLQWEAKANGVLIGSALVVLILVQFARMGLDVARGKADLAFTPLLEPRDVLLPRIALVVITFAFIATITWLGVTLGLFLGLLASLWALGIRKRKQLILVPLVTAAAVYLLFIALLDSPFPHGPVEHAVTAIVAALR
jgi:hypothetical protein